MFMHAERSRRRNNCVSLVGNRVYIVEGIHATILPIIPDNCPRSWCFLQTFLWYNRGQSTRRLVIYRDPLKWKAKGLVNTVKDTYLASLHHAIEYTWLLINYWHVNPLTGALWLAESNIFVLKWLLKLVSRV